MSGIGKKLPPRPLLTQHNQVPLESDETDLWGRAADKLDKKIRKKLDQRINAKREGQTAGSPPDGQAEASGHGAGLSVNDIHRILRTAEELEHDEKNAHWVSVSSNPI